MLGEGLVAVWLHGSAALGGWTSTSDLDVLVVVVDDAPIEPAALGTALIGRGVGGPPLELSVIHEGLARHPGPPWPYLLHVNSSGGVVGTDAGVGDPDLLLHLLVTRARGVSLAGAEPWEVVGEIDRASAVEAMAAELDWALAHADARYAVLNATRAAAFAREGLVLSKVEGARWWLERRGPEPSVEGALDAQLAGRDLGPANTAVEQFVRRVQRQLR